MKNVLILAIALFFAVPLFAQVNFPFPQNKTYPNGKNLTGVNTRKIKNDFKTWWGKFYEEQGSLGRIKFDDRSSTVSEGIGYGMLLAVYMSDNNKSYKSEFNKLWAYYNNFLNHNGLMHWKINGFSNVSERNAATDAELDVAVALIMAYYQFGGWKYKRDALALIQKIKNFEVDGNLILKPGDVWNDKKNPSYFSYFGLRLFAEFDSTNKNYWNRVISANFAEVLENQRNVGISSDWYNPNNPKDNLGTDMGYDGIRTPWRIALGYVWWGGNDARTYLNRLLNKFGTTSATAIKDKIRYSNGQIVGQYSNATFVGGIGSIFMRSGSYTGKLREYYGNLENQSWDINNSYFGGAFDIIYRLTLSGNFPNLMALNRNSITTDVNKAVQTDAAIEVFPNPTTNMLNVTNLADADVEVFNLSGHVVKKVKGNKIDVSGLPVGNYVCVVKVDGVVKAKKQFVKQ